MWLFNNNFIELRKYDMWAFGVRDLLFQEKLDKEGTGIFGNIFS